MFQLFQHKASAPFADDEAVAALAERARGMFHVIIAWDKAVMALNPPTPAGVIAASDPPASIMLACPSRMQLYASIKALLDEAHAEVVEYPVPGSRT